MKLLSNSITLSFFKISGELFNIVINLTYWSATARSAWLIFSLNKIMRIQRLSFLAIWTKSFLFALSNFKERCCSNWLFFRSCIISMAFYIYWMIHFESWKKIHLLSFFWLIKEDETFLFFSPLLSLLQSYLYLKITVRNRYLILYNIYTFLNIRFVYYITH